jgi:hypothetical protein
MSSSRYDGSWGGNARLFRVKGTVVQCRFIATSANCISGNLFSSVGRVVAYNARDPGIQSY